MPNVNDYSAPVMYSHMFKISRFANQQDLCTLHPDLSLIWLALTQTDRVMERKGKQGVN